jgi:hypothetical protein
MTILMMSCDLWQNHISRSFVNFMLLIVTAAHWALLFAISCISRKDDLSSVLSKNFFGLYLILK